ncbi:hypothetical protein IHQ71_00410 [Rhizobium sp. TH2]|uniref:hypothetical protein n=1 Tax=Rhizobium sp. TH2 TaxID=2775403 RepID=UPI002156FE0B|nr:hypothetical protein [Rhizobium sp. TH2]UVC09136.1 hypothetical protein IHQ71_00410 [Rhizobium sp. TH2]
MKASSPVSAKVRQKKNTASRVEFVLDGKGAAAKAMKVKSSMNSDVEKTKIIDRLTEARALAEHLQQDLLVYLIETSLAEARYAFYGEGQSASSPMEPDKSGLDS